jgi:hypothetical protein
MTTKTVNRVKKAVEDVMVQPEVIEGEKKETVLEIFIDHQRRAIEESGRALKALIPEAFQKHSEAAYKEAVEGYRSLVNSVIDEIVDQIEKVKLNSDKLDQHKN